MISSGLAVQRRAQFEHGFKSIRNNHPRDEDIRPFVQSVVDTLLNKSTYTDPVYNRVAPAQTKYDDIFAKKTTADERGYILNELMKAIPFNAKTATSNVATEKSMQRINELVRYNDQVVAPPPTLAIDEEATLLDSIMTVVHSERYNEPVVVNQLIHEKPVEDIVISAKQFVTSSGPTTNRKSIKNITPEERRNKKAQKYIEQRITRQKLTDSNRTGLKGFPINDVAMVSAGTTVNVPTSVGPPIGGGTGVGTAVDYIKPVKNASRWLTKEERQQEKRDKYYERASSARHEITERNRLRKTITYLGAQEAKQVVDSEIVNGITEGATQKRIEYSKLEPVPSALPTITGPLTLPSGEAPEKKKIEKKKTTKGVEKKKGTKRKVESVGTENAAINELKNTVRVLQARKEKLESQKKKLPHRQAMKLYEAERILREKGKKKNSS